MAWPRLGNSIPARRQPLRKLIGRTVLKVLGWKLEGALPDEPKFIVVALPHSSNLDFVLALSVIWGWGLKVNFMAKHTLFKFPQGLFFKSVGGIPVDRRSSQGLVGRLTEEFTRRKQLILGIAPEGSRNTDGSLKEGFARIAQAARVPVLPAIINHQQRTIRIGEVIKEVSDIAGVIASVKEQALTGTRKAPFKL